MASQLFLLIVLSLLSYYSCPNLVSPTLIALLVLVLSFSITFILSKIKQPREDGNPMEVNVLEERMESQDQADQSVCHQEVLENECRLVGSTVANEVLPQNFVMDPDDDQSLLENARWSTGSSEGSISDDDSLIEIALPDGHYLGANKANEDYRRGFLPDFSPEELLRKHGLMELLSEIREEENLIEIDIAMGSIKCSRFEIKASVR